MALISPRNRLMWRAGGAFLRANARYWTGVASVARGELRRWRQRAERIEHDELRELALAKLRDEGFNAQAAAVLATGVRRRELRGRVTRALVALTVLYDFLDGVTESPWVVGDPDPVGTGLDVSRALSEAVTVIAAPAGGYYRRLAEVGDDGGYMRELVDAVRGELARLPGSAPVAEALQAGGLRCAEAQVRAHAFAVLGGEQAIEWAAGRGSAVEMQARDYLAGAASSVLALHALVARSATEKLTAREGVEIDRLYLLIAVLPTLLDSVVDRVGERGGGEFLAYYEDQFDVAKTVSDVVDEVFTRTQRFADGGQHLMIAAGIVGYYTSHPGAHAEFARPVVRAARNGLGALSWAVLAVVYGWRGIRSLRRP